MARAEEVQGRLVGCESDREQGPDSGDLWVQ